MKSTQKLMLSDNNKNQTEIKKTNEKFLTEKK